MAQARIYIAGVAMSLIDFNDTGSKDAGANAFPQAASNTPVNTGGAKVVVTNVNSTNGSGQVTSVINNPG